MISGTILPVRFGYAVMREAVHVPTTGKGVESADIERHVCASAVGRMSKKHPAKDPRQKLRALTTVFPLHRRKLYYLSVCISTMAYCIMFGAR